MVASDDALLSADSADSSALAQRARRRRERTAAAAAAEAAAQLQAAPGSVEMAVAANASSHGSSSNNSGDAAVVEGARSREMQHVLLALPPGTAERTELETALSSSAALTPAELDVLLDRLWARRQEELRRVFKSVKSEAQVLQGLLSDLLQPPPPTEAASASSFSARRVSILEDMEAFVASVHNAEDFTTMGGITAVSLLLNDSDLSVAAGAAWVVGTASKYAPAIQTAALQAGAIPGLLRLLHRTAGELRGAAAGAAAPSAAHGSEVSAASGGSASSPTAAGVVTVVTATSRAVYALGSLLRSHAEAQTQFVRADGPNVLLVVGRACLVAAKAAPASDVAMGANGAVTKIAVLAADLHVEATSGSSSPGRASLDDAHVRHMAAPAAVDVSADGRIVMHGAAPPTSVVAAAAEASGSTARFSFVEAVPRALDGAAHAHPGAWCEFLAEASAAVGKHAASALPDRTAALKLAALDVSLTEAWAVLEGQCSSGNIGLPVGAQ